MRRTLLFTFTLLVFASGATAGELQWSGFALLRGASADDAGPLQHEDLSAQLQLGLDWWASPAFGAHVHLLSRTDSDGERSMVGVPEAYLELNLHPGGDRLRFAAARSFSPRRGRTSTRSGRPVRHQLLGAEQLAGRRAPADRRGRVVLPQARVRRGDGLPRQ